MRPVPVAPGGAAVHKSASTDQTARGLPRTLSPVPPRRPLALLALGAVLLLGGAPAAAAQGAGRAAEDPAGPVVLIGTGGLTWEDRGSDTPTLGTYLDLGSTGQLAVRSVRASACPVDGWLGVSAGRRAADAPVPSGGPSWCRAPSAEFGADGGPATVRDWETYRAEAAAEKFDAEPGLLGAALQQAGLTSAAVGPGAALALAGPDGVAPHAWPGLGDGAATLTIAPSTGDADVAGDLAGLSADVEAALATDPAVLVVDIGGLRDVRDDLRATGGEGGPVASDDVQVQVLDDRISAVTDALPGGSTVFLASLYDRGTEARLRLLAAAGDDYVSSLLTSRSTRQDGLAQTTDLLPTLLGSAGAPVPAEAVGSRIVAVRSGGDSLDRLTALTDLDAAARQMHRIVPVFFLCLIGAQLLLYTVGTLALRWRAGTVLSRARTLTGLELVAVLFGSVPAATFLANLFAWWRSDAPGLAVTTAVITISLPMTALALLGPWRGRVLGPLGVIAAITALVLAGDAMTGSHLMLSSLMGVQPVVAGRFYGFSNPGFALFATACLLAATALAQELVDRGRRRAAVIAIAVIGVFAVIVDGAPGLGADFGGPPAIIPAFAVLGLLTAGTRVTWRRALVIAAAACAVVVGIAVLDWLRPLEDQTHLGRFVQTVLDGGLWSVVSRKLEQNLRILFGSPISALLPLGAAFVALVLARPARWGARPLEVAYRRAPVLRHGLVAFGVLIVIGFALNDSGAVIPAVAATLALPLLIAASAAALREDDAAAAPPATPRPRARPRP